MSDKNRGLYQKFQVRRTDGSSENGGKHDGCEYFVLDLTHDQFAAPALDAYEQACRSEYPRLAEDLRTMRALHKAGFTEHRELPFTSHGKTWADLESQIAALQQEVARLREENRRLLNDRCCESFDLSVGRSTREFYEAVGIEFKRIPGAPLNSTAVRNARAESTESFLLAVREALGKVERWFGEFPKVTDRLGNPSTYGAEYGSNGERDFMRGIARAALSTTSAQAEEIKARLQAEALNEAAEAYDKSDKWGKGWTDWLRARAAQLTAKTGEDNV